VESASDYERVERAIQFIERNYRSQPSLQEVAKEVGLSEHHFQRLFKRWAGISPKRFLQFVTAVHARQLLHSEHAVLDVAYESGLSSASRLHDLMINMEAATPAEIRSGGAGVTIRYGFHESPFGQCFIAITEKGICSLEFIANGNRNEAVNDLTKQWKHATLIHDQKATKSYSNIIFSKSKIGKIPLHVKGTNFQVKVWEALINVPQGEVVAYEDLAKAVGNPTAVRAVANAVAHNPIAFLIPCHRVIRKTGALGGYHWGSVKKTAILVWETEEEIAD
jgi:AraC family transcriptional regulator of adaptative response/methylated-DNA-[protein]-cysteine methyltransferase